MKKLVTILFCIFATVANAEEVKMALLQPRVAEGSDPCRPIERNMVRGKLRDAFGWQSEFQVLTRTDVDAMLEEHGFQQSGFVDDKQRKEVGVMTGAQYICVSTITKDGTQLYIEAYLVNIETGQMTNPASQYVNVVNNNYELLIEPCNELAKKMLGDLAGTTKRSTIVGSKQVPTEYVDLGLPSGTLWKAENEDCGLIKYDKAYNVYGSSIPTEKQWSELASRCFWTWTGNGYIVKGKSGESIFLPAAGWCDCNGSLHSVDTDGFYWSSTQNGSAAWTLGFYSGGNRVYLENRCNSQSVRLVR